MTVDELGERMSGAEFVDWMAWFELKGERGKPSAGAPPADDGIDD